MEEQGRHRRHRVLSVGGGSGVLRALRVCPSSWTCDQVGVDQVNWSDQLSTRLCETRAAGTHPLAIDRATRWVVIVFARVVVGG